MSKGNIIILFLYLLCPFAANAEEINEKVNVDLGADLVEMAMIGTPYKGAGYGIPPENPKGTVPKDAFLIYQILGKYEGTVAWFAVNPWTGDVWNMNECMLFSNPELLKAQARVKKRFNGNELKEYKYLHDLKPYRMYDLEPCP